ncbi:hypothetical protein D3C80_1911020 [compost metagenome]
MGAQRCLTARAVRANAVCAVHQTFVMHSRQDVPHALDVCVIQRYIRIIQVGPVPDCFREFTPLLLVAEDTVLAFLDEFLDAVLLDLLLA